MQSNDHMYMDMNSLKRIYNYNTNKAVAIFR